MATHGIRRRTLAFIFVVAGALLVTALPALARIYPLSGIANPVTYASWEFYDGSDNLHYAVSLKSSEYAGQADPGAAAAATLASTGVPVEPEPGPTQEFVGWYLKGDDGSWGDAWLGFPDNVTFDNSTTCVYAKFRDIKHYLTYHSAQDTNDDGTFDVFPTIHVDEVATGEEVSVSANNPLFATPPGTGNVGWAPSKNASSSDTDSIAVGQDQKITLDDNMDLYPIIEGGSWVSFDTAGGTSVDRQFVSTGASATEPAAPTRQGYDFREWVDASGNPFDFDTPITEATTVTATWEVGQSSFKLRFFLQGGQPKDTVEEDYTFESNYYYRVSAQTGSTISLASNDANIKAAIAERYSSGTIPYYYVNADLLAVENAKETTVAADGSTEFNVYLDRMWYYLRNRSGNTYKWRWGQELYTYYMNIWATGRSNEYRLEIYYQGKTAMFIPWSDIGSLKLDTPAGLSNCARGYQATVPETGIPCGYVFSTSQIKTLANDWKYNAYTHMERLDSSGTGAESDYDEVYEVFYGDHDHWAVLRGKAGFTPVRWTGTKIYNGGNIRNRVTVASWSGKSSKRFDVWYDRNDYDIIWEENGGPEATNLIDIPYQTDINGTVASRTDGMGGYVPYDKDPDEEGFERPTEKIDAAGAHWFAGWHKVNTLVDDVYSFDGLTMPAGDIKLFADWTTARRKVTYDLAGGSLSTDVALVGRQAHAGDTTAVDVVDYGSQTVEISASQVTAPAGYGELLGWTYELGGRPQTWSFSNQVHDDVTLRAVYAPEGASTTTHRLTYDVGGGSGEAPVDDSDYLMGSNAYVLDGSYLQNEGRRFLYWRDEAGNAHYSGNDVTVADDETLTAVYAAVVDPPTTRTTQLTYDFNYDSMSPNKSLAELTAQGSAVLGTYVNQPLDLGAQDFASMSGVEPVGYTFQGWHADAGSSPELGEVVVDDAPADENVVYAHWTRNAYDVAFHANDEAATGSMATQAMDYDISENLDGVGFTKTGYHLAGWSTEPEGAVAYTDQQSVLNLTATDGDTFDLYAQWDPNPYTITFDKSEAAAEGSMTPQAMTYDATAALEGNGFSLSGFHLLGWATEPGGSLVYTDGQQVSNLTEVLDGDVTLYALWEENGYYVSFDGTSATSGTMANQSFSFATPKNLSLNAYSRDGYDFAGWATSEGGAKVYDDGAEVSHLTTVADAVVPLFATWTAQPRSLTYLPGAEGADGQTESTNGVCDQTVNVASNGFDYPGYDFAGWVDTEGAPYARTGATFTLKADEAKNELTAQWSAQERSLIYEPNGGDGSCDPTPGHTDETVKVGECGFTRAGYTFMGWTVTNEASEETFDAGDDFVLSANADSNVLYAQWSADPQEVTYDVNASSIDAECTREGQTASTPGVTDEEVEVAACGFTASGYVFTGWNTAADGSGDTVTPGQSHTLAPDDAANTLYAQWQAVEDELTCEGNGGTGPQQTVTGTCWHDVVVPACGFERSGYDFASWNTSNDGTGQGYMPSDAYKLTDRGDTLFALWDAQPRQLVYRGNGAGGTCAPTQGHTDERGVVSGSTFDYVGHDFVSWNTEADGSGLTVRPGDAWIFSADEMENVLYAQWKDSVYTVTFDTGAGSRVPPQRVVWGERARRPEDPRYAGRTFEGWVDVSTGKAYDFDAPVTRDLTIRALWGGTQVMYRLYNPNSGEHFYTASTLERDATARAGWTYEGIGWVAPLTGSEVYRLYNANAGDHHYTISAEERDALVAVGWSYEGVGWLSAPHDGVAVWREYNPNALAGAHNFTTSRLEHLSLVRSGWKGEGIAWYGV